MIEGHGNDRYNYGTEIKADFSSNIAFNANVEPIIKHLKSRLGDIMNYPDPTARTLSRKIAKHHEVDSDSVVVCNGSSEAFYMVAHHISRTLSRAARSLIFIPSFSEYEDSCRLYGHTLEYASLRDFESIDYSLYDSVWLGTPNNPDGYRVAIEDIERIATSYPNCTFVVDRAYNDLSASCDDAHCSDIANNIILLYSLTKSFGIPGLRLGYVLAHEQITSTLKELHSPWSVNSLSLAAGEYVMDHFSELSVDLDELLAESQYLQRELAKIEYLEIIPSDSNFFMCRIADHRTTQQLHEYLLKNHSLLIRNASNFRGLTDHHFRVAAHRREYNNLLIESLKVWM